MINIIVLTAFSDFPPYFTPPKHDVNSILILTSHFFFMLGLLIIEGCLTEFFDPLKTQSLPSRPIPFMPGRNVGQTPFKGLEYNQPYYDVY